MEQDGWTHIRTCAPKKATFGPKIISAITDTANNKIPSSKNLFKYFVIVETQFNIIFLYIVTLKIDLG